MRLVFIELARSLQDDRLRAAEAARRHRLAREHLAMQRRQVNDEARSLRAGLFARLRQRRAGSEVIDLREEREPALD